LPIDLLIATSRVPSASPLQMPWPTKARSQQSFGLLTHIWPCLSLHRHDHEGLDQGPKQAVQMFLPRSYALPNAFADSVAAGNPQRSAESCAGLRVFIHGKPARQEDFQYNYYATKMRSRTPMKLFACSVDELSRRRFGQDPSPSLNSRGPE